MRSLRFTATTTRPPARHVAYATRDLDSGLWRAQCDGCDLNTNDTTAEADALVAASLHMTPATEKDTTI